MNILLPLYLCTETEDLAHGIRMVFKTGAEANLQADVIKS